MYNASILYLNQARKFDFSSPLRLRHAFQLVETFEFRTYLNAYNCWEEKRPMLLC